MPEKTVTIKPKWYAAIKNSGNYTHCDIIKDCIIPTSKRYPQYSYMFGGYTTRCKALEVAMYYNFYIDSPESFKV